jgi:hypothetical protein
MRFSGLFSESRFVRIIVIAAAIQVVDYYGDKGEA